MVDHSVRNYFNALMMDLALADPDQHDAALLRAGQVAQALGSLDALQGNLRRDAGFGKRELDRYQRQLDRQSARGGPGMTDSTTHGTHTDFGTTGSGEPRTLRALIDAQAGAALPTDDVLVLVLPLFAQVAALHAQGRVAVLDPDSIVVSEDGALRLRRPDGNIPVMDIGAVHRVQPHPGSGLNIVGALQLGHADEGQREQTDLALQLDATAPIERPVYLPGPASWERLLGHHDEIGDVFLLGMVLASSPAAWTSPMSTICAASWRTAATCSCCMSGCIRSSPR
ncbi:hypothetical protein ACTMU2_04885 [Cupriavidus basilensis]